MASRFHFLGVVLARFFDGFQKRRKEVHFVDLGECFPTYVPFLNLLFEQIANSNEYLLAKFGPDTAENGPFLYFNLNPAPVLICL